MAIDDIARGTLVSWGDAEGREVELWALYTSRRLLSTKVSAFLDHLAQAFPKGTSEELAVAIGGEVSTSSDAAFVP
jgi:DNA-binding transcriptional LysR family regulator